MDDDAPFKLTPEIIEAVTTHRAKVEALVTAAFEQERDYMHAPFDINWPEGIEEGRSFDPAELRAEIVGVATNRGEQCPPRWTAYRWRPDWRDVAILDCREPG